MKSRIRNIVLSVLSIPLMVATAQNFKVPIKGMKTFSVKDDRGRNQVIFQSKAPLEDITGTTSGMDGWVKLDPSDVVRTIQAEISVDANTLKTGITMRDEHLVGDRWLDAKKNPTISFKLKKLTNVKSVSDTEIQGTAIGDFTLNGVTKEITSSITLRYLVESEKTRTRAPGDLLSIRAECLISLHDFNVKSNLIGSKVAEKVSVEFNAVGSSVESGAN